MLIPKQYAPIAVEHTAEQVKKVGIIFDNVYLDTYKKKLQSMASANNYEEFGGLEDVQSESIKSDLIALMTVATGNVARKNATFKRGVKADEYVFTALNHLLAVTENELGSPDFSYKGLRPFFRYWIDSIVNVKPRSDISLDETFNDQRRIDAEDLRNETITPLLNNINNNNNAPENVAKLYAEYKALVRRQKNHGFFWRLFHSDENEKRNALIQELANTLNAYVPNLDIDANPPLDHKEVMKTADARFAFDALNTKINSYQNDLSGVFGYKEALEKDELKKNQPELNVSDVAVNNPEPAIQNENPPAEVNAINANGNEEKANEEIIGANQGSENANNAEIVNNPEIADNNVIAEAIVKEEDKAEDKEADKEIINENSEPAELSMADKFKELDCIPFREETGDQLWDIIGAKTPYSVNKASVINGIVNNMFSSASILNEEYDKLKANGATGKQINKFIHNSIKEMYVEAFHLLINCQLHTPERTVVAQQILDIVLNKATVIGFNSEEYSMFANGYALAKGIVDEFLTEEMKGISREGINDIITKAKNELNLDAVSNVNSALEKIEEAPEVEEDHEEEHEEEHKEEEHKEEEYNALEEPIANEEQKGEEQKGEEQKNPEEQIENVPQQENADAVPQQEEISNELPKPEDNNNPVNENLNVPANEDNNPVNEGNSNPVIAEEIPPVNVEEKAIEEPKTESQPAEPAVDAEEEAKKKAEEEEVKRKAEEERLRKLEEERLKQAEEERLRKLEEERLKKLQEEEAKRIPILEYVKSYSYESLADINADEDLDNRVVGEILDMLVNDHKIEEHRANMIADASEYRQSILDSADKSKANSLETEQEAFDAMTKMTLALCGKIYNNMASAHVAVDPVKRIRIVEDIANIFLKTYSPVAISNGAMDSYANDNIFSNPDIMYKFVVGKLSDKSRSRQTVVSLTGKMESEHAKETRQKKEEQKRREEEEAARRKAEEEEARRKAEEEEKRKQEEEEARRKAEEEQKRLKEEARKREEEERLKLKAVSRQIAEDRMKKALEDPDAEKLRKLNVEQRVAKATRDGQIPDMNTDLYNKCREVVNNVRTTLEVNKQLEELANQFNPKYPGSVKQMVNKISTFAYNQMLPMYLREEDNVQIATAMARGVYNDIYQEIGSCGYDFYDRIYVAQEMTDVLMRTYSPCAFVPDLFDAYADYHVFARAAVLQRSIRKSDKKYSSYAVKENRELIKNAGSKEGGSGPYDRYDSRRKERKEAVEEALKKSEMIGKDMLGAENVTESDILAYQTQYLRRYENREDLTARKSSAEKIFAKIGFKDASAESDAYFKRIMYDVQNVYNNMKYFASCDGTYDDMMTYTAKEIFKRVHDYTKKYDLHEVRRLALAQQLADVILNAYSPASFNEAKTVDYTKNFVIGDADNLKLMLNADEMDLSDENVSKIKESVAYANENLSEATDKDIIDELKEIEANRKAEEERKRKAEEEECQRKVEEEARKKAEEEERLRKLEEEKIKAEKEEARKKVQEEERLRRLEEEKKKAEEEQARKKAEEEEAKKKAEEETKRKAEEEEAKRKAEEEEAKRKLEEENRKKLEEEEAKRKADEEEKLKAEEEKTRKAILEEVKANAITKESDPKIHELAEADIEANKNAPHMNSILIDKLDKAVADENITSKIKNIVVSSIPEGAANEDKINIISANVARIRKDIVKLYSRASEAKKNLNSKLEVERMANTTFVSVYSTMLNANMNVPSRLIASQNIANELMRNYLPCAFVPKRFDDVLYDYTLRNDIRINNALKAVRPNTDFAPIKKALNENKALQDRIRAGKARASSAEKEKTKENQLWCSAIKANSVVNGKTAKAFKNLFECAIDNKNSRNAFKNGVGKILKGVVNERFVVQEGINILDAVSFGFDNVYNNLSAYVKHEANLDDIMNYTARGAFEICYGYLNRYNLTKEKQAALAQKLANLAINTYSPVNFTKEVPNEKYADFVTKDSDLLKTMLEKLDPEREAYKEKMRQIALSKKEREEREAEKRRIREEQDKEREKEEAELKKKEAEEKARKEAAKIEAERNYKREIKNPIGVPAFKISLSFIEACEKETNESLNDTRSELAFERQAAKILDDLGIEKKEADDKIKTFTNLLQRRGMKDIYKEMKGKAEWREQAPEHFMHDLLQEIMKTYSNGIVDSFEDFEKGVIASRRITQIIARSYSPAAFVKDGGLNKYVDSYFVDNGGRDYFVDYAGYRMPVAQIRLYNEDKYYFVDKIIAAEEKFEKINYERKPMQKYERKVERRNVVMKEKYKVNLNLQDDDVDFMRDECKKSINDTNLTEYVEWQISKILSDSGVAYAKIKETANRIVSQYLSNDGILSFYEKDSDQKIRGKELKTAAKYMVLNSQESLMKITGGCYSDREMQLVATQKILDVFMKNYSPVAFVTNDLNQYADNFIINDKDNIFEYYRRFVDFNGQENNVELYTEKVKAAREKLESRAPANEPAVKDEQKNAPQKEKITVDLNNANEPKPTETKVEAARPEEIKAESSNSLREAMSIPGLSESVVEKKSTTEVKEAEAPAITNVKQ